MSWEHYLFEREEALPALYMTIRGILMFLVTLVLIRIGGSRIFGEKSVFDAIIIIVMGSVLARGVVGASSLWATVVTSATMVLIHRLLALTSLQNKIIERLIKGKPVVLYKNGKILYKNLRKASLSESDLMTSLRLETKKTTLEDIDIAFMEVNGRISFIAKPANPGI